MSAREAIAKALDDRSELERPSLLATGLYSTRTGVVGQRLLEEHGEALQGFLCIRTGTAEKAAAAYDDLTTWLNQQKRRTLEEGPSLRAVICRAARVVSGSASEADDFAPRDLDSIPWEPAPFGSVEGYERILDHVRRNLRTVEAELLALRFSHALDVAELAYVFDEPVERVERHLQTAFAWADLLVSEAAADLNVSTADVVCDAFRVIPAAVLQFSTAKAPRPPRLAAGTRIGERYEIVRCIGGGTFAWVYEALDVHVPGHTVALKMLHRPARTTTTREGAVRELSLIASAFHPSLVQFKDHGWFCDRLWFVMPWYDGETLASRLARGPLALDEALPIFASLARGLAALHGAGVVHHDVKPDNVFLAELRGDDGRRTGEALPVLLDLGVAAPEGELALAGTPVYFAPEAAGRVVGVGPDRPITPKADVFALALALVHALTEAPVDQADVDLDAFLEARASRGVRLPSTVGTRPLRRLLARALAIDPADRPSAEAFAGELLTIASRRVGARTRARTAALLLATSLLAFGLGLAARDAIPTSSTSSPAASAADDHGALRARLAGQERRAAELERQLVITRRAAAAASDSP